MNQSILKNTGALTFVEMICPMAFDVAGEFTEDGVAVGNKGGGPTVRVIVPRSGVEKATIARMFNVEFHPADKAKGGPDMPLVGLLNLYLPPASCRMYEFGAEGKEGGHEHGPTQFIFDRATADLFDGRFKSLQRPCSHHTLLRSWELETANYTPINVYAGGAILMGFALDDNAGTATPFAESVPDWRKEFGGHDIAGTGDAPFRIQRAHRPDVTRIVVMGVVIHDGEDLDFLTVKEFFYAAHAQGRDAADSMWKEAVALQGLNRAKRVMSVKVPGFAEAVAAFERGDLAGGIDAIAQGLGFPKPEGGPQVYVMGDGDAEPRLVGQGVMAVEEAIRQATGGKAPGQEGGPNAH